MRGRILLLLTASLLPWTAAGAQPLPADPSPDAMEVARAMIGTMPFMNAANDPDREQQRLEGDLLSTYATEPPCDRANAECLAAARAVAREFAPAIRQRSERLRDRMFAFAVMDALEPEQLRRLAAHLRTDEGRDLVRLWHLMFRPDAHSEERRQQVRCRAEAGLGEPWREARRAFRERTAGLPRAEVRRPSILPPAPPPSPRC